MVFRTVKTKDGPDGPFLGPTSHARQSPAREEHGDARGKETRIWTERTRREHIDQKQPHADELSEPPEIVDRP
jgi:hypothetical protein